MEDLERVRAEGDSILSPADNCGEQYSTYTNRELSWLSFNERVLEEAAREGIPLANRLNYLAIYQSNLDEFFRVRVGALTYQSLLPEQTCENKTGLNAGEQLAAIMAKVRELNVCKEEVYSSLHRGLAERGIRLLIMAAENGKRVEVLLELKARFDEENNIRWSRRLEQAGCKVVYGLSQLKVHAKLCLISGREKDEPFYISYVGTGNFNEKTAQLYTDYALLTARSAVGQAVERVFCALMAGESVSEAPPLLVAPHGLQRRMLERMEQEISKAEAGRPAYIGIKINALTDKKIIDQLIMASKAGVQVDLLVRGICCLKPGIPDETDNIRVVSVVGRFLEHSRVYIFGRGEAESIFISSADFMTRNASNRVEVALPVLDAGIKEQLRGMFRTMMRDNYQAWEQHSDGSYQRVSSTAEELNSQEYFFAKAYEIAAGRK